MGDGRSRVGVIADGPGDFTSLKSRYPTLLVTKATGPRGHNVSVDDLASSSVKQISSLVARGCAKVILMTDRESRNESSSALALEIRERLRKYVQSVVVEVVLPDRMIENWYLADIEQLSKKRVYVRKGLKQKKYEGTHGKSELKKLLVKNCKYGEVEHGPQLFTTIRTTVACVNSATFRNFEAYVK